MKEILVFTEIDGDSILELEFDYNFNIGDFVNYVIPIEDRKRIEWFYSNSSIEGIIVSKWIDLTCKVIKWQVDVDFVRCDEVLINNDLKIITMKKEELMDKWCKEYDLLVSDINYQKDKIKRGKVQQLHLCIQDLKSLTLN